MSLLLAAIAYVVYTAFGLRLLWHFFFWIKAFRPHINECRSIRKFSRRQGWFDKLTMTDHPELTMTGHPELVEGSIPITYYPINTAPYIKNKTTFGTTMLMVFDVIFFRRVLAASGPLWFGSLLFHLSFLIVILRHLRYFTDPVPLWVIDLQTCGLIAGYLLPASVLYLLSIRIFSKKDRYLTYDNYLILGLVLLISITGFFMRFGFRPDLVNIKEFSFGLLTFRQTPLKDGYLFVIHLLTVLSLVLLLPSHIFSAPLTTMMARRRENALGLVMHEK